MPKLLESPWHRNKNNSKGAGQDSVLSTRPQLVLRKRKRLLKLQSCAGSTNSGHTCTNQKQGNNRSKHSRIKASQSTPTKLRNSKRLMWRREFRKQTKKAQGPSDKYLQVHFTREYFIQFTRQVLVHKSRLRGLQLYKYMAMDTEVRMTLKEIRETGQNSMKVRAPHTQDV